MQLRQRKPDAFRVNGHARPAESFQHRVIFTAAVCAATLILLLLLWKGRYVLLCVFGGVVGAVLLSSMTSWVQRRLHIPRGLALAFVLVFMTASVAGLAMLRGPALVQQLGALQADVPRATAQILSQLEDQHWGHWILTRLSSLSSPSGSFSFAISGIRGVLAITTYTITGMVLMLFISLFLAIEPDFYLRGILRATPARYRATLSRCLQSANSSLESWLFAKFLSMIIIGIMVASGLWILRVPMPGTLGTLAGILTFIPNVGPILSVVPAALLSFAISPGRGALTILLYLLVHFLEGNLVTPLAERSIVTLPPALTLTTQLVLGTVTGALGIALAAPVTAVMLGTLDTLLPPASDAAPEKNAAGHKLPPAPRQEGG